MYSILPEILRWLWHDYPGVISNMVHPGPDEIVGDWEIETNIWGFSFRGKLTLSEQDDRLVGKCINSEGDNIIVSDVSLVKGILSFGLAIPDIGEKPLEAWLKVEGNAFEGALGSEDDGLAKDFPVTGKKR